MTVNSLCNAGKYPKLYIRSTELSLCYRPCNDAMALWSTALCHITCRCLYLHSGMPHFAAWSDRQSLTVFPFRCSHSPLYVLREEVQYYRSLASLIGWRSQTTRFGIYRGYTGHKYGLIRLSPLPTGLKF